MTRLFILIIVLFSAVGVEAQYYYRDVLLTNQTARQLNLYKKQGVRTVEIRSFESNNPVDENFSVKQTFESNYTRVKTISSSSISGPNELITLYNAEGRLLSTTDTSEGFRSTTAYRYTPDNRIAAISNISYSPGGVVDEEVHEWSYKDDGAPEKMLKIKNSTDTTTIQFELDEEGRIGVEKSFRNGRQLPVIYYYYDDNDRLTDIVRYNEKARRLLPDLIFEYDSSNRMKSMMVIPEGSDDYQLWVYSYDESGLKTKETCLNKDKNVLGYVQYDYNR